MAEGHIATDIRERSAGEQESKWQAQSLPAEVVSGPHKENCSPELLSASQLQVICTL